MNEQLADLLYQSYPKIFAELHAPEEPRGAALGIMCSDGWFDLLDVLCHNLQFQTDRCGAPQIVASQVKEKFGELSFHRRKGSEAQRGMIAMAEAMSSRICEPVREGRPFTEPNPGGKNLHGVAVKLGCFQELMAYRRELCLITNSSKYT